MAVEINFDDLKSLVPAAGKLAPGSSGIKAIPGLGEINSGQDLMQSLTGLLERVNSTITNVKELFSLARGITPGQPGQPAGTMKTYQPPPTLFQQLHRVVNVAYNVYGDITVAELLQSLLQQYGNTKLSAALKALERF